MLKIIAMRDNETTFDKLFHEVQLNILYWGSSINWAALPLAPLLLTLLFGTAELAKSKYSAEYFDLATAAAAAVAQREIYRFLFAG